MGKSQFNKSFTNRLSIVRVFGIIGIDWFEGRKEGKCEKEAKSFNNVFTDC
jgi:hypothetical protein